MKKRFLENIKLKKLTSSVVTAVALVSIFFLYACSSSMMTSENLEGKWEFVEGEMQWRLHETDEYLIFYKGGTAAVKGDGGGTYDYVWEIDDESEVVNVALATSGSTTGFTLSENDGELVLESVDGEATLVKVD